MDLVQLLIWDTDKRVVSDSKDKSLVEKLQQIFFFNLND